MPPTAPPFVPPKAEFQDRVLALLAALGIDEVVFNLNGSGDSGDCDLESVHYHDGREIAALPATAIGFRADGTPRLLPEYLNDIASSAPEGNWYDNEGGYGTVTINPHAGAFEDAVFCDMTYREEGDYGDDDDDEEDPEAEDAFLDLEIEADDPPTDANNGVRIVLESVR